MSRNQSASFRGCSPKLFTDLGPLGTSGFKFKYYVINGGPYAGIYYCQKTASALAKKSSQSEPKGYHEYQQQLINDVWMHHCSKIHDHPPSEMLPYVDPFAETQDMPEPRGNRCSGTRVQWEEEMAQAVRMTQTLTLSIPSTSTPQRPHSSTTPFSPPPSKATFAKVDPAKFKAEARPYPCTPGSDPSPSRNADAFPASPSKPKGKAKASTSRSPSPTKAFWNAFVNEGELNAASDLEEEEEPIRYFVVRYQGGADYYFTSDEAFGAFRQLRKQGLKPSLRTTTDCSLAEEFANRA
ncbi:hypothetical protein VKT23_020468 [Stygiomarasmius scandens]|uniref:Uncharacterized protein n=1 Tax=Marasmiellus scandens TaxID=2682957 RepID=A0ABR1IMN6_9AGAR